MGSQYFQLILEELHQLRGEGIHHVALSETSFEILKSYASNSESLIVENKRRQAAEKEPSMTVAQETLTVTESIPEPLKSAETFTLAPIPEEAPVFTLPKGNKQTQWEWLRKRVLECPVCSQHVRPGKKVVFGSGSLDSELFFCGEAPGKDEEEQGEVFVGKAGQLLQKIIEAMGFARKEVYIANIMNWRPEMATIVGNRPPTTEEMAFCLPYLKAQLAIVQPKVIIALGATAVSGLLGQDSSRRMKDVCNQWFRFENIPLMVTFHPSYLLRNNTKAAKRNVWEAMLKVLEFIGRPISEKQNNYFL